MCLCRYLPSVLSHCWLVGSRKGIWPVTHVVGVLSDLTGAMCYWFAHVSLRDPLVTTATYIALCNSEGQKGLTFWYQLTQVVLETDRYTSVVVVVTVCVMIALTFAHLQCWCCICAIHAVIVVEHKEWCSTITVYTVRCVDEKWSLVNIVVWPMTMCDVICRNWLTWCVQFIRITWSRVSGLQRRTLTPSYKAGTCPRVTSRGTFWCPGEQFWRDRPWYHQLLMKFFQQ